MKIFREFFWLFEERSGEERSCLEYENVMRLCGTYEKSCERFSQTAPLFAGFKAFLNYLDEQQGQRQS